MLLRQSVRLDRAVLARACSIDGAVPAVYFGVALTWALALAGAGAVGLQQERVEVRRNCLTTWPFASAHVTKQYYVDSPVCGGFKNLLLHLPSQIRAIRRRQPFCALSTTFRSRSRAASAWA